MKYWVLMRARARAGCQGGGEAGEDDGYLLLLAQAVAAPDVPADTASLAAPAGWCAS